MLDARVRSYVLRWTARNLTWVLLSALAACSGVSGGSGSGAATGGVFNSTGAVIEFLEITPGSAHLAAGTTAQLKVTAIYSDGSHQDVTSKVTWTSSNATAATVSNGMATGLSAGSSTISATLGKLQAHANLTVTPAILVSIEVTPPSPSAAKGTMAQFTATGVFSDKSTQNLTSQVQWVSSNTTVATIVSAPGAAGLASAANVGSTKISAGLDGVISPAASFTVTAATLVSIQVTPPSPSIANGLTQQFTATGLYTDNSTQNLTSMVSWVSSNTSVAAVSSAGLATSAGLGSTNISASFGAVTSPTVSLTVTPATLVSIQVTPPSPSIANGLTQQFTATGLYTDNSTQNLTSMVTWSSSSPSVASISNASGSNGLATTAAVGTSSITATFNRIVSPAVTLTVTPATLASIQVNPPSPSIADGLAQQFTATGTYTDNSTQDLTGVVTWASANTAVASISNAAGSNGLATSAGVGTSSITATSGTIVSPAVTLTVTPATLVAIQVNPPAPGIAKGLTQQFTATGTYTDNSTQDLTTVVTWASATTAVATISNASGSNGLATAAGVGTSSITATSGTIVSPAVTLTVTPATLVSIQVNPPSPSIANGLTQQFTATGTYTDNSTQDLTAAVTWTSAAPAVATISNVAGSNGLATSVGVGTSSITATSGTVVSPAVILTVTPATLVSIQVNPPAPSIANGLTQQFTATGTYTDNTTQELTAAVTWSSSNGSVASISNVAGSAGLATALGVGTSSITASSGTVVSPAVTLTVTPATLVSIKVMPASASIAKGLTQQFTATGIYTDNSTQDLTTAVTWASSNGVAASISNAAGSNGLATALAVGTSSITATSGTIVSAAVTLTVTPAVLLSIQVGPSTATIPKGLTQQFSATGTYSDTSTQDLTTLVTWASSPGGVASISNTAGSNGLATALGVGTANVSASYGAVSSPDATLTVTAAALVSIEVAPATATIAKGTTQQFTATGTYTDTSTQDLTTVATWASATSSVATVSNAAGSKGLATAVGVGSSNISAAYSGVTSPHAVLTVVAATATAGIWTATPAPGVTAFMISDAAGNAYYYTSASTCLALSDPILTLTGSTVTGTGYTLPDVFGPNGGCAAEVHESFTGTLVQDESLKLTSTPLGGGGGSPVTVNWTFDSIYFQPSALSLVAGTWTMTDGTKVTVSATGAISAHDTATGCTITGKLAVSNTTVNVYTVTAKYSGCTGSAATLNGAALSGLGMLDTTVAPSQFHALVRSVNSKKMSFLSWVQ